jgi:hypothetical protein
MHVIYTSKDTIALKPKDIYQEDITGTLKVDALISVPSKLENTKIEVLDRADAYVFEVKQKIIRQLKLDNAEEFELYLGT